MAARVTKDKLNNHDALKKELNRIVFDPKAHNRDKIAACKLLLGNEDSGGEVNSIEYAKKLNIAIFGKKD